MDNLKQDFKSALLNFDSELVKKIIIGHSDNQADSIPVLISEVLSEIGDEWVKGDLALSQVYMSGIICEEMVESVFTSGENYENQVSKIAIVTFNDFHALGRKIVLSVLRSVGFSIIDFGNGINIQQLIDKIIKENIDILLVSVLMLPSALKVKELREELNKRNMNIKILVGGAPFNFDNTLWQQVGADAMGRVPTDAIPFLKNWLT